jgi:uncharacterized membrane protein
MAWEFIRYLAEHALERSSRSSVVTTLIIMGGLLATALLASAFERAPPWMSIFFAVLLGLDFVAFLAAYAFFAYKAPDSLRSERFYLQKMAIERGLVGDSLTGLIPARESTLLPSSNADESKKPDDEA